jgi:hypothetical protein
MEYVCQRDIETKEPTIRWIDDQWEKHQFKVTGFILVNSLPKPTNVELTAGSDAKIYASEPDCPNYSLSFIEEWSF